ncbi:MAG: hypothetical protein JXA77_08275 [Bacteroidales bacterium]|nr:hypothetical protein [Bacteroidales bacterium]MBN2820926.1 hypothetical protein [Bacteroidales bacterium]
MLQIQKIKQTLKAALWIAFATGLFVFTSCEEEQLGPPEIYQVRTTDPEKADSTFTGSEPGKLIAIQGKNFTGLLHVYLNGIDASFNPAFQSDKNILVWVPAEVPLSAVSPEAPNTIRVVTQTGEASYEFRYLAPVPEISYFDFKIPLELGSTLNIVGTNFYVVERVYFTRNGDTTEITAYTVSENYNQISFTITDVLQYNGEIGVITESGASVKTYTPNPPPEISGFSNELPVQGDTFSIYGIYFGGIDRIVFPDGNSVPRNEITLNEKLTKLTLTMPSPSTAAGNLLLITAMGDTSLYPNFNNRSHVLYDFDGRGNWVWDWDKMFTAGTQAGEEPFLGNGNFYRFNATVPTNTDWWDPGIWGMSVMWPANTVIAGNTPIDNLALSITVNTIIPWTQGYLRLSVGTAEYFLMPWEDGTDIPTDKWIKYSIPFSDFTGIASFNTYSDLVAVGETEVMVMFKTTNTEEEFNINICMDDLRINIIE